MFHSLITLTAKLAFVAGLMSHPTHSTPSATHTDIVIDQAPTPISTTEECCPAGTTGSYTLDNAILTVHDAGPVPTNAGYTGTLDPNQTFTINLSADFRVLKCYGQYASEYGVPATIPASSLTPPFVTADALVSSGVCYVEVK